LLVRPVLWEGLAAEIDGEVNGNFVTSVDIYRLYNDPSVQAQFEWEPLPDEECDYACGYWFQSACLGLRDRRRGMLVPYPGTWQIATEDFSTDIFAISREPDRVRLWYLSGEALDGYYEMKRDWQRAIAYYATALLQREVCGCEGLERFIGYWRKPPDLEYELYQDRALDNPFGIQRGAVFAWDKVQQNLIGRGIAM